MATCELRVVGPERMSTSGDQTQLTAQRESVYVAGNDINILSACKDSRKLSNPRNCATKFTIAHISYIKYLAFSIQA